MQRVLLEGGFIPAARGARPKLRQPSMSPSSKAPSSASRSRRCPAAGHCTPWNVAVTALAMDLHLELGLSPRGVVLLALTLLVASLTLGTGRTTVVQGVVHLVIFATWLFTTLVP